MTLKSEIGEAGEQIASEYLVTQGFQIIERNWRAGRDEVDIICENQDFLVFVEVKTRSKGGFIDPEQAVDKRKQRCLMRAAESFIQLESNDKELRFDVISIIDPATKKHIFHIEDAFYSTLG